MPSPASSRLHGLPTAYGDLMNPNQMQMIIWQIPPGKTARLISITGAAPPLI